jgi:hypothetical protein
MVTFLFIVGLAAALCACQSPTDAQTEARTDGVVSVGDEPVDPDFEFSASGDSPIDNSDRIDPERLRGAAEALAAIDDGRVRILYIGEQEPEDHVDRSTGLPGESMGCEWDEAVDAYVNAWNEAVVDWWDESSPFVEGGSIEFTRRGAGENLRIEVTGDAVRVAHGAGVLHRIYSSLDERMQIAAWVTAATLEAPTSVVLSPVDSIRARSGEASWTLGTSPPIDERAVRLLEEMAGRPGE